jgi:hypothetical protein
LLAVPRAHHYFWKIKKGCSVHVVVEVEHARQFALLHITFYSPFALPFKIDGSKASL